MQFNLFPQLPESISALDEKLETLRGDNELVLEKVADVKELMKLADSAILGKNAYLRY